MRAVKMIFGILSSGVGLIGFAFLFIALNRFWNKRDTISDRELISVKKDLKIGAVLVGVYALMVFVSFSSVV